MPLACLVPETLISVMRVCRVPVRRSASAYAGGAAKESVDALVFPRVDRLACAGCRANCWPLAAHLRLYPRLIAHL